MLQPPYDRTVALACSLATFEGRWISARCRCQMHTLHPVRLMLREQPAAAGRSLADAAIRLRCTGCGGREMTLHLCEKGHGPGPVYGGGVLGWVLLLHDRAGEDAEAAMLQFALPLAG